MHISVDWFSRVDLAAISVKSRLVGVGTHPPYKYALLSISEID